MYKSYYLEHSAKGSQKKDHKYIDRVWKNGKWFYKYKLTGKGYKDEADKNRIKSDNYSSEARKAQSEIDRFGPNANRGGTLTSGIRDARAKDAAYYGRKAAEAESKYYTQSVAGISEKSVKRGLAAIKDFFTPTTTVRVTSNLMPANTEKVYKKRG